MVGIFFGGDVEGSDSFCFGLSFVDVVVVAVVVAQNIFFKGLGNHQKLGN